MLTDEWAAAEWTALATILLAAAAITGGCWATYIYHKSRRLEAAKWLRELFSEFYLAKTFADIRAVFEYHYDERLGPLIERRLTHRELPPSMEDVRLLEALDGLLNYFEFLLYLEREGQLASRDRKALFAYWFELLNRPTCGGLRRYVDRFGFERIARELDATRVDYLMLYGSLMACLGGLQKIAPGEALASVGHCEVKGRLVDVGDYPGLVGGDGIVVGELYKIEDLSVIRRLDAFERFDPMSPGDSLFCRRCVRLHQPPIDAWVYVYNGDAAENEISTGDWREHSMRRAPATGQPGVQTAPALPPLGRARRE